MVKVKICGLTNLEDARVAMEAGADLLGFIFYEASPRYVTPARVQTIVAELAIHKPAPLFVGVFVNKSLVEIRQLMEFCRLDAAQLHGDEPPELVSQLPGRAYKALRPQSLAEAEALIATYQPPPPSPAPPFPTFQPSNPPTFQPSLPIFLLDAYHPALYGGTGQVTDWSMAAQVARRHRLMLAGSLTPANVAEAIRLVRPWGVDVSSGVEMVKGKKDHAKVRAFVEMVKTMGES